MNSILSCNSIERYQFSPVNFPAIVKAYPIGIYIINLGQEARVCDYHASGDLLVEDRNGMKWIADPKLCTYPNGFEPTLFTQ